MADIKRNLKGWPGATLLLLIALIGVFIILWFGEFNPEPEPWPVDIIVPIVGGLLAFALLQLGRALGARPSWFLVFLLCVTAAFYVGSIGYQSKVKDMANRSEESLPIKKAGTPTGYELRISYPGTIPLEPPDKPGWALSAYLWPPVAPTATATPTAATGTPTATATPTPTGTTTATPTATFQSGQAITYTLAFSPTSGNFIVFTDEKGNPVSPSLVVTWGGPQDKPAVLYLRQAEPQKSPITISVTAEMHDAQGAAVLTGNISGIGLEDSRGAWWRHFFEALLSPTTLQLALVGSVVTLAVWWWQEDQKRRREEEALEEIRKPRDLVNKYRKAKTHQEEKKYLEEAERRVKELKDKHGADSTV